MAAATSGIWNHAAQSVNPLAANSQSVRAMDDGSGGTGDAGDTGATITANDFLTLLVTEMKNQDPTATTDPNEYINQLVNVNSLQQLISINQTLNEAVYVPTTSSSAAQKVTANSDMQTSASAHAPEAVVTHGNFSAPEEKPSALRVAQALGHSRVQAFSY